MTDYEKDILNRIEQLVFEAKLSNDFLVSNLKLSINYLNLKTIAQAAKERKLSTQWIRRKKDNIIKISGVQFIVDNE